MEEFMEAISRFSQMDLLHSLLGACVILLLTAFVSHLTTSFIKHLPTLTSDEDGGKPHTIFINIGRVVVWCLGIFLMAKICFNIDLTMAAAALGIGGIAISLGFQDTIANIIGGLQVSILHLIKRGDYISFNGESGVVQDITWRHTTIKNALGEHVVIPNSLINKSSIKQKRDISCVVVPVSVATSGKNLNDLAGEIERVATDAAAAVCPLSKEANLVFTEVTEFGFIGSLVIWTQEENVTLVNPVKNSVIRAIAPLTREESA